MKSFDADPLGWLDEAVAGGDLMAWLSAKKLCVFHADAARRIMRNADNVFLDHSDFFETVSGLFGPRQRQIGLSEDAKRLIVDHAHAALASDWLWLVPKGEVWPRAGGQLMWRLFAPVLARPQRSKGFHKALGETLEARIFAREGDRMTIARRLRRFRYALAFARERERHGEGAAKEGRDLLDVVFDHGEGADDGQLMEVYNSLVFAVVSSMGLTLSWALLLAGQNQKLDAPANAIVLESLRLYPVAWYFERRLAAPAEIEGVSLAASDIVAICPYAMHRSPIYWENPNAFLPERWERQQDRRAWMPFGAGPHMCVAGGFVVETIARMVEALAARGFAVKQIDASPQVAVSLAPPRFELDFSP